MDGKSLKNKGRRFYEVIVDIFSGKRKISTIQLILGAALFFVLCDNATFFQQVLAVYPLSFDNIGFLLSLAAGLIALLVFVLTLISSRHTLKPVLMLLFIASSLTAYFMDSYNVVIDDTMIQNIAETNWSETYDLISWGMLSYLLFLGILPAILISRVRLVTRPLTKTTLYKLMDCGASLLIVCVMLFGFSKFYTSFFREHKPLRYYTNPSYYLYSIGEYIAHRYGSHTQKLSPLGLDAKVVEEHENGQEQKELVILVVGEAVRADHLSLNGYHRETNPLLEREDIINFSEMYSCGTSTAYSVPCMFSNLDRKEYSPRKGRNRENILDVLSHTEFINILWRDNNSDSKGVALRVPYEDFSTPVNNPVCMDGECRDEGMLVGLDAYVDQHPGKDILIVLHQMGNHGPAYYKRYPEEFEKFRPICKTNQLEECTREEIINGYDNALLYSDYFLSKVITFLKGYETSHNTAMLYFSDHGESLGENGLYLHGMPYVIAPESQTHIGSFMWFGEDMKEKIDMDYLRKQHDQAYSHDNLFHTLLGLFEVKTEVYNRELDILYDHGLDGALISYSEKKNGMALDSCIANRM